MTLPARYAYAPLAVAESGLDALLPSDPAFATLKVAAQTAPALEAALARIDAARAAFARNFRQR